MKDPAAFDDKVNKEEGHKKGCRCKRSKCLKKYCECYNAGVKCNPAICQCVDCCNEYVSEMQASDFFVKDCRHDVFEAIFHVYSSFVFLQT